MCTFNRIAFHFCLSKVHVNTLLAQLNARAALLEGPLDISKVDFHISGVGGGGAGAMSQGDMRSPGPGGFQERSPRSRDLERGPIRIGGRSPPKAVAVSLERLDVERAQTGSFSKVGCFTEPLSKFSLRQAFVFLLLFVEYTFVDARLSVRNRADTYPPPE